MANPGRLRFNMIVNELERFSGWRRESSATGALEDCSLIIATYQRPAELACLLQTLIDLPDAPGEVVVVDGSPGDSSETKLLALTKERSLPFDLIYVRTPAGLTRQRNIGIDVCSGEYIFFLDDDCLPHAGYFKEIRRVFIEDQSGEVGAVGGLDMNGVNRPISLRWRIRLALHLFPQLEPRIYHPAGTAIPDVMAEPFSGVRPIDVLSGFSMAFRRKVLDKHRFSEFFYGYAQGEDLEMSLRVRREWNILWCGDARVVHNPAEGGRPTSFQKGRMEVRNRHFIWKRYSPDAALGDKLRFWLDMVFLILMDVACFAARPRRLGFLSHAAGVVWGIVSCIVLPPSYKEPPARKKYDLCLSAVLGE